MLAEPDAWAEMALPGVVQEAVGETAAMVAVEVAVEEAAVAVAPVAMAAGSKI
jgi:hypothetical protein